MRKLSLIAVSLFWAVGTAFRMTADLPRTFARLMRSEVSSSACRSSTLLFNGTSTMVAALSDGMIALSSFGGVSISTSSAPSLCANPQHVGKLLIGPRGDARIVLGASGSLPDGVPPLGRLLGIKVDHQNFPVPSRRDGQMQRQSCFTAAALLTRRYSTLSYRLSLRPHFKC